MAEHKEGDKKDHILQVAEELFAQNGFEGTSIRDLAAKADVNLAMISYYFGSKEKLFEEMVQRRTFYMRQMMQQLKESDTDPWHKVYTIIDMYVDKILSNVGFHKILLREITMELRSEMNIVICDIVSQNAMQFAAIINDGIKKKVFKKVDVPLTIATILGTINQSTSSKKVICKVLGEDPETYSVNSEEHKNRLKKHLKLLITAHLQKTQEN
jgi:AcrR family transcriptional regulator